MPQRAILKEKSGSQAVQAFQLADEEWKGIIEASRAGVLELPCCGVIAQPRAPMNMVRHFAHPPHTLQHCPAKPADAGRDTLIVAVARMAEKVGWSVVTEAKFDQYFCDIICSIDGSNVKIGFEFETGVRPNDELKAIDRQLREQGVTQLHWFFKKGRKGGYPGVAHKHIVSMAHADATDTIVKKCRDTLTTIKAVIENTRSLCGVLDKQGVSYDLQMKDGIPVSLHVQLPESVETHQIHVFAKHYKVSSPDVPLEKSYLDKGERIGAEQKTIIQIVDENLASGVTTWWDDYPELKSDSFARLRMELAKQEQKRQERYIKQQQWLETKRHLNATTSGNSTQTMGTVESNTEITRAGTSFADMRLRAARSVLKDYYGDEYNDELLDSVYEELNNKTPRQIVYENSQSTEAIEKAFGYRDDKGKPLRKIPVTEL